MGRGVGAGQDRPAGVGLRVAVANLGQPLGRNHRPDGPLMSGLAAAFAFGGQRRGLAFDVGRVG